MSKKYHEDEVKYIIMSILNNTVDRISLNEVVHSDLLPVLGQKFINDFYLKLNAKDVSADSEEVQKWLDFLNQK